MTALGENRIGVLSDGGSIPLTSTIQQQIRTQIHLCRWCVRMHLSNEGCRTNDGCLTHSSFSIIHEIKNKQNFSVHSQGGRRQKPPSTFLFFLIFRARARAREEKHSFPPWNVNEINKKISKTNGISGRGEPHRLRSFLTVPFRQSEGRIDSGLRRLRPAGCRAALPILGAGRRMARRLLRMLRPDRGGLRLLATVLCC